MAYEISSSVAAATFKTQNITTSFAGASFDSTPGGKFSPDGTKLAQSNYYYNGNDGTGDVDSGIDIYQSSSDNGWTRTESINAGAVVFYDWRTDNELWGIGNNANKIYKWTSSSVGGWSSGQADSNLAVEYTAGDEITKFKFNYDKDKIVAWYGQDDDNYNRLRFWLSSSQTAGVWDSTGPSYNLVFDRNIFDIEWGRVTSDNKQYMHLALPNPASGQGMVDSALVNSTYSSIVKYGYQMNGGSGKRQGGSGIDVGWLMYYHSASDSLIVGERDASYNYNIDLFQSQSDGTFLDTSNKVSIATNVSRFSNERILPARDPDDEGRFIFSNESYYSGGQYNETTLAALESGSEGWKYTAVANVLNDGAGESFSFIDISPAGDIVSNNDPAGTGGSDTSDGIFTIRRFSDLGTTFLGDSTSEAIVKAAGGTVSAGNTADAPRVSVTIPGNSLSANTTIGVDITDKSSPATLGIASDGGESISPVVRLTPHGTQFSSAVTVTFRLTGTAAGTCPANAQLFKRNSPTGNWYPVPTNLYSCTDGVISLSTTSFSDYIVIGGQIVARTKLNNVQLARLENVNKVLPEAINISGSSNDGLDAANISDLDLFLVSDVSDGLTRPVSGSQLKTYFAGAGINVTGSNADDLFRIVFVDPTLNNQVGLAVDSDAAQGDADGLRYKPSTNTLVVGGPISGSSTLKIGGASELEGTLNVEGAASFDAAISGSTTLSIGGATELEGTLNVEGAASFDAAISGSTTLSIGGATELEGTLNVEGAATFDSTISGSSNISAAGTLHIGGNGEIEGTLNVEDAVTFDETLVVNATSKASATDNSLLVEGTSQVKLTANEFLRVTNNSNQVILKASEDGDIEFGGGSNTGVFLYDASTHDLKMKNPNNTGETAVLINDGYNGGIISGSGDITMKGAGKFGGKVAVSGAISGSSTLSIGGATQLEGTLNVEGAASFDAAATFDSNVTVAGNLVVNGTTTQIDTTNLLVEDAIIVLADGNGAATVDQGLVFTRGGVTNQMFLWDESADQFALVATAEDGATSGSVTISSYSAFQVGDITGSDATLSGDITVAGNVAGGTFSGDGSGLSGVGASVDTTSGVSATLQIPFVSGSSTAATFFVDSGAITFNPSSNLFAVDGPISGSSTLIVGASEIEGTLNVEGVATFDSNASVVGNFDVDGATTLDGLTVAEAATMQSAVTITDSTESTTTGTGALIVYGGIGIGGDANFADDVTLKSDGAILALGQDSDLTLTHDGGTGGALAATGDIEINADGGNITLKDGSDTMVDIVANGTVDVLFDAPGDIRLDAGGFDIKLEAAGTEFGRLSDDGSSNFAIFSAVSDKDMVFKGNDGGSTITALTLDMSAAGAATFNSKINVSGAISGSSTLSIGGASQLEGTLNVEGAVDLDSTLNVDGAVTLASVAALSVDLSDETHHILVQDSDDGIVKKTTFAAVLTSSAGNGLQTAAGKLKIETVDLVATQYQRMGVLSDDYVTASLVSGDIPLSGSLQVFLNGMLLVGSSSAQAYAISSSLPDGAGVIAEVFDYYYYTDSPGRRVEFVDAIDEDDVIQVKYIKQ